MSLVSAVVVFFLIWWVVLFTILPIGTRPDPDSDAESGWRGTPQVSAPGLFEGGDRDSVQLAADLARAVGDLPNGLRREDDALREAARSVLRKAVGRRLKKRPNVEVHLLRV